MAENLAPDHWERYTQLLRGWQQTFKKELRHLQRHYNHSGVASLQQRLSWGLSACGECEQLLTYTPLAFGKAWKIWLMEFGAYHLFYIPFQLFFSSPEALCLLPYIPIWLPSHLLTCMFFHSKYAWSEFYFLMAKLSDLVVYV